MTIAIGLPTTPWIPERAQSFSRVLRSIGYVMPDGPIAEHNGVELSGCPDAGHLRVFADRESNRVWPGKMWRWALGTGADHFLTLQDDTVVAPNFWPALRAMLAALPPRVVLGLSAVSPYGPEVARQGHRFYATKSFLVGWAYLLDRETLREFVAWQDAHPKLVEEQNEDDLLNAFVRTTGRQTWHPVPSIVDHDVAIASTYANDGHSHRRSTVTWHGYPAEALEDPKWWAHNGSPPILDVPNPKTCSWCSTRRAEVANGSGMTMCRMCIAEVALGAMGVGVQKGSAT